MAKHSYSITQDWKTNFIKGKIIMTLFRTAHLATLNKMIFIVMIPYLVLYRVLIEWVLGIEIPYKLKVGGGLRVAHGQSLVIHDSSILGSFCTVRHCTTIGKKIRQDGTCSSGPVIGDHVDIGANVCIIGEINIGDNVIIGSGSVVVKDVPSNSIVAGNPARVIKTIEAIT